MNSEIKVPSMGESISEAVVGQILAPEGTVVKADAEVLELETDKVNQVLYAPQKGIVHLTVKSGDTVKIGQTIGSIELGGESASKEPVESKPSAQEEKAAEAPQPSPSPAPEVPTPPQPLEEGKSVRHGKDSFLRDLEPKVSREQTEAPAPIPSVGKETRRPMSKIRKVIAHRMVEALQTTAMLTTFNEVDMTQVMQLREKYRETFTKKYGCKLGFMSFFIKAALSALKEYPDFNSSIDGDEIVHRGTFDIGVAVGTEKGVIVPVVRNCDLLSYAEVEQTLEAYARKAREGKLKADELQGGGFTITNGGVYGSLLSTPILLPPQCGILGMHKIEKRPVVVGDQIVIRSMMYLALSYDHRLVDGKEAVSFLVHIKNVLEEPSRILLEI